MLYQLISLPVKGSVYITLHYISGGFRGSHRSGSLFRPYRASQRGPDRQVPFIAPFDRGLPVWPLNSKSIVPAPLAQRPSGPHNDLPLLRMSKGVRRPPSDAFTNTRGQTSQ